MAEYIEREALLQQLEMAIECKDCPRNADRKTYYDRCACSEIQDICDAITEAPKADVQPVNQWISVDDRLPEEIGYYLVVIGNEMLVSIDIAEYSENHWHKHDKVLYWQPLPEIPEEAING